MESEEDQFKRNLTKLIDEVDSSSDRISAANELFVFVCRPASLHFLILPQFETLRETIVGLAHDINYFSRKMTDELRTNIALTVHLFDNGAVNEVNLTDLTVFRTIFPLLHALHSNARNSDKRIEIAGKLFEILCTKDVQRVVLQPQFKSMREQILDAAHVVEFRNSDNPGMTSALRANIERVLKIYWARNTRNTTRNTRNTRNTARNTARNTRITARRPPIAPTFKLRLFDVHSTFDPSMHVPSQHRSNSLLQQGKTAPTTVFTTENAHANNKIAHAFASVLGQRDVNHIIARLSEEAAREDISKNGSRRTIKPFFLTEALKLTPFERTMGSFDLKSVARSGRHEINRLEPPKEHERGIYGQMYRSEDGKRIYKSITFDDIKGKPDEAEQHIRNVFIETFIQTVLVSDPDVGHLVCRPLRLFRDSKTLGPEIPLGNTIRLFILMEPIAFTLPKYVQHKGGFALTWFIPFLAQLGHLLNVLKRRYNFSHRDLHTGNIMFTEDGDIKLIDFGFSCLEFRGLHYSAAESIIRVKRSPEQLFYSTVHFNMVLRCV